MSELRAVGIGSPYREGLKALHDYTAFYGSMLLFGPLARRIGGSTWP